MSVDKNRYTCWKFCLFIFNFIMLYYFYVGAPLQSPGLSQVGATPFSPVYPHQDLTNFLLIPDGIYTYFITYLPIVIESLTTILNSIINSFYPLDTALILTSGNFLFIFPPSPPLLPSFYFFPWWLLLETVMWCHLYYVFPCIHSFLIDKDLCEY